jgi:hypothetical protein
LSFFSSGQVPLVPQGMMEVAPCCDIDDDGDGFKLWPYLPLAPHTGIVSRLWRRVLSPVARRGRQRGPYGVRQHSVALLNAVGDVSSQPWPITVTGRIKACLLPS